MGSGTTGSASPTTPRGGSVVLRAILALVLALTLLPLAAPPASAASAATASVDRRVSFRNKTYTYTFTVTNTSTAGETVGSVSITRPQTIDWSVGGCPQAPTGWIAVLASPGSCTFNSAAGTGDDIAPGSSQTFQVLASISAGKGTEEGVSFWGVATDNTGTFNGADGSVAATGPGNSLAGNFYSIELTDAVVETTSTAIGAPCPPRNRKAPAGSTRVLTICGRNHANVNFMSKGLNSGASGTFIANLGNFQGTTVPPVPDNVVLGTFPSITVTSTVGTGLTVSAFIGNAPEQMTSPTVLMTDFTTDTTPPPAPTTPDLVATSDSGASATDNITYDNTPTFVGSAEPASTVEILVSGVARATATAAADGSFSATVPGASPLADGAHTVTARAIDPSGNASPESSGLTIRVDTGVPADPTIDSRPGATVGDPSLTWAFSGEGTASFTCKLDRPDAPQLVDSSCLSPKTYDVSAEADGTYTFRVSQTDLAGNTSGERTDSTVVDRQPPDSPTITSSPPEFTSNQSVAWSFTGESGSTYECELTRPDATQATDLACFSPKSYNLNAHPDGLYTFRVRQTDSAGHQSSWASDTFTLDRQAPSAPTITSEPNPITNDPAAEWDFTGEAGGSYECVLTDPDGAQTMTANCNGPKAYDLTGGPDGSYTFQVRQTDAANNTGPYVTVSFTLDRQAPTAPSITGRPANITSDDAPEWTFTGEFGASYECVLVRPDNSEMTLVPCFSPSTFDLSAEDDGAYTFKVRQIDAAGNPGSYATDNFTLDREAPAAPSITDEPATESSDDTPSWTFTGEPGAVFDCILVKPDATEVTDAFCSSPKTFDLSSEADGTYTFKVRQTDGAGHQSAYSTAAFTLDREAPLAPTITSEPVARTNDETPEWSFTGEPGGTYECRLTRPDSSAVTDTSCSSSKSYDLATQPDGLYTFEVRQADAAGNAGPYAISTFTLDRQAPSSPTITGRPANLTSDQTPDWTYAGELGASYECILVRPDTTEIVTSPCGSPTTFDLAGEPDGDYIFKVRQIDLAGNPGPYATDGFTLDRQAPDAPVITDGPLADSSDDSPEWSFTGESGGSYECVLVYPDGAESAASCSTPESYDLTGGDDGLYTFKVRQTDGAGNTGPYAIDAFMLDRAAPGAPVITSAPPARTNDATPEWNWTGEPEGTFECVLVEPGGAQTTTAGCAGPKGYDLSGKIDGLYTFKVRQIDAAGSAGLYASSSFTLDRLAPAAPVIGTKPADATNDSDPVWTFTGETDASFECELIRPDGTAITATLCESPTSFALADEPDGSYTFRVRQIDAAGNLGPYATDGFTLDRVEPDPPVITSRPANFTSDDTPTWTFTGDHQSAPFECALTYPDGTEIDVQPCPTPQTFDLSLAADGTYTFRVRQLDDAGNKSLYTSDTFTLDRIAPLAPAITSGPADQTNDDTPTWGFSGESNATYECVIVRPDGSEVGPASCSSPHTFALNSDPDGLYTFKVRQTDRAGNTGPYAADDFMLDRQSPEAPSIDVVPATHSSDDTPTWEFSGEFGASYECVLVKPDGSEVGPASCSSPHTFALNSDPDGLYTFKVRQIDEAGNTGPYASDDFTLDRVPPAAPTFGDRPVDDVNDDVLEWTFSGETNATFECVLVKPDLSEVVDPSCTSPKTLDLAGEPDGDYTFKVRQIDEAGHPSDYITDTFTLDREAPIAPTITAMPPERTNDSTPEWSFTGEPGGVFTCVLVRADNSEIGPRSCSSPHVFSLLSENDGDYTFKVRQTDDAGNVGPYATDAFFLDRERPQAPMFTSLPPSITANTSPRWSFTGEVDAVFECLLQRPDGSMISAIPCSSPHIFSLENEPDGTYTMKVRQIDVAGNVSGYATDSFTLDREAPTTLVILSEPPAYSSDATPEWDFVGEAQGSYECVLERPSGAQLSTLDCHAPKTYNLGNDVDGLYTFKVRQTDSAFNKSPYVTSSFTLDRRAPIAPEITSRPANLTTDSDPDWEFTGEASATYECRLTLPDGSWIETSPCSSPATFALSDEDDGNYTFKVRQLDRAGNVSPFAGDDFVLDRTPPETPTITTEPPDDTFDSTVRWEFTGENGGTYECVLVKPGDVMETTENCSTPSDYDLTAESDGTYSFMVRQYDDVGNVSGYATSSFNLDRVAPDAPTISSTPEHYYDTTPEWGFTGEDGGTYECALVRPDNTEIAQVPCSSPATFDLSSEPDGTYVFKVRQIDAAGNTSGSETVQHLFNKTPPTPVLSGGPPALTNNSTHETSFTGEPDAVFECTLTHPDGSKVVTENCSSPYAIDVSANPDGDYIFEVRQFIGPNGSLPAVQTFTVDRTVVKPAVEVRPGPIANDPTPKWTFEGEQGAAFDCVLVHPDGTEIADSDCRDPEERLLEEEPDGDYILKVRQTDPAGNVSGFTSRKYHLDRVAPDAPVFDSTPDKRTRDLTPSWSFEGEDGASFSCKLTAPNGRVDRDADCGRSVTFDLNEVEGKYELLVTQTDRAGNESTVGRSLIKLDLTKPAAKRLRVRPKSFVPTRRTMVKIRFRRSEPAAAKVVIKKGTRKLRVWKKPVARKRVEIDWRTVYKKKVIKPGKYRVIIRLKDKAGWTSRSVIRLTAKS